MTIRWRELGTAMSAFWPVGLAIVGFLLAAFVGWIPSTSVSAWIRYTGIVLELMGLATVAHGLNKLLKEFGQPGVLRRIWDSLRQVVRAFRRTEPTRIQPLAGSITATSGMVGVMQSVGPGATVERRLEVLENKLSQLQHELDRESQDRRGKDTILEEGLRREREERSKADGYASALIQNVAIGNFHLEFVGLVWLGLGVFGTSLPDEVAAGLAVLGIVGLLPYSLFGFAAAIGDLAKKAIGTRSDT